MDETLRARKTLQSYLQTCAIENPVTEYIIAIVLLLQQLLGGDLKMGQRRHKI